MTEMKNQSNPLRDSLMMMETKEIHTQSKEQFFSIKKQSKRLKSSQFCESEVSQQSLTQSEDLGEYKIIRTLQSLDIKELHYSLAETEDPDTILEFKSKQPKKKKMQSKIHSTLSKENLIKPSIQDLLSPEKILKTSEYVEDQGSSGPKNSQLQKQLSISPRNFKVKHQKVNFIPFFKSSYNPKLLGAKKLSIENFLILKQLGEGTYSKVYKAIEKKTGFVCALKIISKQLVKELNLQKNAIRQIKILSCISSPYISNLYGAFSDEKNIYLILQLCTEGDVNTRIQEMKRSMILGSISGDISEKHKIQIVDLIKQTTQAINELHSNQVIHRDIKPQNVMLTLGNNVKLSDFGWAVHNPKNNLRKTLCGTPLYLAPEFISTGKYNDAIDVWSLGVMTYELCTGELPFVIKSVEDLVNIVKEKINFDRILCPILRDLVKTMLIKDYRNRIDVGDILKHQAFIRYKKID